MDRDIKTIKINVPSLNEKPYDGSIAETMLRLFASSITVALETLDNTKQYKIDYSYGNAILVDKNVWTWRPESGTLAIKGKISKVRTPILKIHKNAKDILQHLQELDIPYGTKLIYIDSLNFLSDKKTTEQLVRPELIVIIPDELPLTSAIKTRLLKLKNVRIVAGSTLLASLADTAILDPNRIIDLMWFNCPVLYSYRTTGNIRFVEQIENSLQHGFSRAPIHIMHHAIDVDEPKDIEYFQSLIDAIKIHDIRTL